MGGSTHQTSPSILPPPSLSPHPSRCPSDRRPPHRRCQGPVSAGWCGLWRPGGEASRHRRARNSAAQLPSPAACCMGACSHPRTHATRDRGRDRCAPRQGGRRRGGGRWRARTRQNETADAHPPPTPLPPQGQADPHHPGARRRHHCRRRRPGLPPGRARRGHPLPQEPAQLSDRGRCRRRRHRRRRHRGVRLRPRHSREVKSVCVMGGRLMRVGARVSARVFFMRARRFPPLPPFRPHHHQSLCRASLFLRSTKQNQSRERRKKKQTPFFLFLIRAGVCSVSVRVCKHEKGGCSRAERNAWCVSEIKETVC